MVVLSRRWSSLVVLSLVGLVIGLDTTVLNVALPTLGRDLQASTVELQWFANAYLLALAVLLLPAGLLGDRFGRKPMTLVALVVFGGGSLGGAYAGTPEALIAARVLMGVGAAVLTPATFAWLVVLFEEHERPRALGVLGGASFLGMPLGPILAGVLLDRYFWGSVFLINIPVVLVALLGSAVLLPSGGAGVDRGIDLLGILLSVVGLGAVTYGLIEAPLRGWGDPLVLVAWPGGLAVLVGFVLLEIRQGPRALMNLSLWRVPAFRWGTGVLAVSTMLGMSALFSAPIYLQGVLGVDVLGAGIRLVPLVGGILVGVVASVALAQRNADRAATALGFLLIGAASVLAAGTTVDSGYARAAVWLGGVGCGFGMIMVSGQNLALGALDEAHAGVGSAVIQVMRQTGGVIGIAVLISVLNTVYRDRVDVTGLPPTAADAVRDSVPSGLAVAERIGSTELVLSVREAFVHGMRSEMRLGAGLALAGATVVLLAVPRGLGRMGSRKRGTETG